MWEGGGAHGIRDQKKVKSKPPLVPRIEQRLYESSIVVLEKSPLRFFRLLIKKVY